MSAGGEKAKSTIVIKRYKRAGHAAHGAAWKIAYADFVTAMMAFFLLMWLLGSTTKGDLKGISEYFQSPLQVSLSGGDGSGDSNSVVTGGGDDLTKSTGEVKRGEINGKKHRINEIVKKERARMEDLAKTLNQAIENSAQMAPFKDQIRVEITPDGLRIQIIDDFNRPMFDIGSAHVKDYMRQILREFGKVLNDVDSKIVLTGHTDSAQYAAGDKSYSNWELSADRANASRRELVAGGMEDGKVLRVVGLSSAVPFDKENPDSPVNRRISILIMNKEAEEAVTKDERSVPAENKDDVSGALQGAAGGSAAAAPADPAKEAPSAAPGAH